MLAFYKKNNNTRIGFLLLTALIAVTFGGAAVMPNPNAQDHPALDKLQQPSKTHPFGTDHLGRDVLARVFSGGKISLAISLSVVVLALTIGTVYGLLSALLGGVWDQILMRLVDAMLSFPITFLAVTCIALFGSGLTFIILVLALTSWMDIARLVRAEVLSLKNRPFITRVRASGIGAGRIIRHFLPHLFSTLGAFAVLRMADVILIESSLSFIGLGVEPPQASWGTLLNDGWPVLDQAWWLSFFPGLAILVTIFSLHLISQGLGQTLEER